MSTYCIRVLFLNIIIDIFFFINIFFAYIFNNYN